ncbi:hypothetical protein KC343_g76 [Hortaea werneckii]|nr:hypothetical protein KC365_g17889 [Hortaea werneckii]KAI7296643.1 hypothetical protein KC352_g145 [Hortaea werneckii]KAI7573204.1 hypothetical protein KC317_g75 [Hortaea werneckii]KAI7628621.1 hypothetical protein KC346_g80 [Hortaea werneckii]KAI7638426.1 hypothetical protein KC343_g76 [Hortaea werneckii]
MSFSRDQQRSMQMRHRLRSPSAAGVRRDDGQRQPDSGYMKPLDSHKRSTEEPRERIAGLVADDGRREDNLRGSSDQEQGDDTRIHLDGSRTGTLARTVASVFNENGKGQHQKHLLGFKDHESAERTSDTIGEGLRPPKRNNVSSSFDRRKHLDGSRNETLAQKVAGVFDEIGKEQQAFDVASASSTVGTLSQSPAATNVFAKPNADAIPNDHYYGEATVGAIQDRSGEDQAAESLKGHIGSYQDNPSLTVVSSSPRHVDVDEDAASQSTKALQDSDDEPLNAVWRRSAAPKAQMPSTPMIAPEEASGDSGTLPKKLPKTNPWRSPTGGATIDEQLLFEPVPQDQENITSTALPLFDEWPEYNPARQIDREAKIAEIKRRPSRKAMFGKPAFYSRLGSHETSGHSMPQGGNLSTENPRGKRALSVRTVPQSIDPFPVEPNVVYYDTLEKFLGLPQHPVPVMHNGQLAYRDGTKDHSSRVRKAQAYFPTGSGG